jgi:hypothetical protein
MHSILKQIIYIVLISNSPYLFAQKETRTMSASASAIMVTPISISVSITELDFGQIILTGTAFYQTIDALSGITFTVNGNIGRTFVPTFGNIQLTNNAWTSINGGTLGTITFIPSVKLEDGSLVTSGNIYPLITNGLIGTRNLYLGGTINIASNQPQGDYVGTFTMTVSY